VPVAVGVVGSLFVSSTLLTWLNRLIPPQNDEARFPASTSSSASFLKERKDSSGSTSVEAMVRVVSAVLDPPKLEDEGEEEEVTDIETETGMWRLFVPAADDI
jgi:hypothetical protein